MLIGIYIKSMVNAIDLTESNITLNITYILRGCEKCSENNCVSSIFFFFFFLLYSRIYGTAGHIVVRLNWY